VPLTEWVRGPLHDFVLETLTSAPGGRAYLSDDFSAERLLASETAFGRSLWGLLSLEVWQQQYHDRAAHWRALRDRMTARDAQEDAAAVGL